MLVKRIISRRGDNWKETDLRPITFEKRKNSKGEITIMLRGRACNIYKNNKLWLCGTMKFKTSYKDENIVFLRLPTD